MNEFFRISFKCDTARSNHFYITEYYKHRSDTRLSLVFESANEKVPKSVWKRTGIIKIDGAEAGAQSVKNRRYHWNRLAPAVVHSERWSFVAGCDIHRSCSEITKTRDKRTIQLSARSLNERNSTALYARCITYIVPITVPTGHCCY